VNLEALRASLAAHEGKRNLPYEDSEENLTIGIGHLLSKPISDTAVNQIFEDDIAEAIDELDKFFPGWRNHDHTRQNVLAELCFNMGPQRLAGFKLMWAALDVRDYAEASKQLLDSRWRRQVKEVRANKLAEMLERGDQ
jgi:lysozyme